MAKTGTRMAGERRTAVRKTWQKDWERLGVVRSSGRPAHLDLKCKKCGNYESYHGEFRGRIVCPTEDLTCDPEGTLHRAAEDLAEAPTLVTLGGVEFEVLRVDGDRDGGGMPNRLLLGRDGVTAEYILTVASDGEHNLVQEGTWPDLRSKEARRAAHS